MMRTTRRPYSSLWSLRAPLLISIALLLALCGCGEDGDGESAETLRWDTIGKESTEAIALTPASRGFGYFQNDSVSISSIDSGGTLTQDFGVTTLRAQLLGELRIAQKGPSSVADARFSVRIAELRAELEATHRLDNVALVLDLMRLSDGSKSGSPEPYLSSWHEKPDLGASSYGFYREDYRAAVLDEIKATVKAESPAYFIVGAEMLRLLDVAGGDDDMANFVTFYREAYEAIKSIAPNTRVGVGINWVTFQQDIVPRQVLEQHELPSALQTGDEGTTVACNALPGVEDADLTRYQRACTDKAFRLHIEPFLQYRNPSHDPDSASSPEYIRTADILSLSASARSQDFGNDPAACPADFFGYLRNWSTDWPVVYYAASWQTNSSTSESKQEEWLRALLEHNAGVNIELLSWSNLKDYSTRPDCDRITANDIGAPTWLCFQGLFSESARSKTVYDLFMTGKLE